VKSIFWLIITGAIFSANSPALAVDAPKKPLNLLFIITDQQRWDAMSCAGNQVVKTPNLDQLARDGARFTSFYSACPVCVPARTAILTGHDIDANHVLGNNDVTERDNPPFLSFDQILLRNGYRGEYHGKFHSPYKLAMDYTKPVRWLNGQRPPGSKADMSDADAFKQFLAAHEPKRSLQTSELVSRVGVYQPIHLDQRYGKVNPDKGSEGESYGRLETPSQYSIAAFTAEAGLAALNRLKDGPFTLTISFDPPHPPMIVSEPYYSMYPPKSIPVPVSINDPRTNSPYASDHKPNPQGYRDPVNIQEMASIYYGMVTEVDDWVGKILKRLDELGLAQNTLVIFTSDHGEMLGDHGMHSKMVFYEGADHVSLLMRLPGVIPTNTVVAAPASHLDLFPTILDYLGQKAPPVPGKSLRPLIEGKDSGAGRVAVSEWNAKNVPGYMIFDGRWKYMCGRTADAPSLDALYDLKNDPYELDNLIGRNPEYQAQTKRMRALLVEWLRAAKSPLADSVKARPMR
jgi:arylsulfatase A-like enzyme